MEEWETISPEDDYDARSEENVRRTMKQIDINTSPEELTSYKKSRINLSVDESQESIDEYKKSVLAILQLKQGEQSQQKNEPDFV